MRWMNGSKEVLTLPMQLSQQFITRAIIANAVATYDNQVCDEEKLCNEDKTVPLYNS